MLKHRLTGAAVLIGFAVVVLPMLLGGPEEPIGTEPAGPGSNEPESNVFRSNITPIGGDTPSVQAASEPENAGETAGEASEASANAGDAATDSDPGGGQSDDQGNGKPGTNGETDTAGAGGDSESASEREAAPTVDQTLERGWIVQVGTFKNAGNVAKLVAQLKDGGFSTSTSEVDTSEGRATRVWVGPYETRVEAARHKTRVKQSTGTEGLIVAYP